MPAIIVARSKNDVIGVDGGLPWDLPSDLRRFKALTMHLPVIMGRKTYDSLPDKVRPLPGRENIVLSRQQLKVPGVKVVGSIEAAVDEGGENSFIMGGASVYEQGLEFADRILITEVLIECDGDAFFPRLEASDWVTKSVSDLYEENGVSFRYVEYVRRAL